MSSKQQLDERPRFLQDVEVFDLDFHLTESLDDFISYLDEPFYSQLVKHRDGDYHLDNFYPNPGYYTPYAMNKVDMDVVRSHEDILAGMETINVDNAVITPGQILLLGGVQHDQLATALAKAYNRWLLDNIVDPDNGIYTTIVAPTSEPDKAAEEIDEHANEDGVVGTMVSHGAVNPPLGDEQYWPIYEASQNADLPIIAHGAAGASLWTFPNQFQNFNRFFSTHVAGPPMLSIATLTSLIERGVPVEFPDLDWILLESGIGWFPYLIRRLDHEYYAVPDDVPMLEKKPSEYITDQIYISSQPVEGFEDPEYLRHVLQMMDAGSNLMFSSDYPHYDFDNTEYIFQRFNSALDDDQFNRVCEQNARDVLRL